MRADLGDLRPEQQRALRRADGSGFRAPMLATLSKGHPGRAGLDAAEWVFERKLDGVRVIATREPGGAPRLCSRDEKSMDASYPEIVDALADQGLRDDKDPADVVREQ